MHLVKLFFCLTILLTILKQKCCLPSSGLIPSIHEIQCDIKEIIKDSNGSADNLNNALNMGITTLQKMKNLTWQAMDMGTNDVQVCAYDVHSTLPILVVKLLRLPENLKYSLQEVNEQLKGSGSAKISETILNQLVGSDETGLKFVKGFVVQKQENVEGANIGGNVVYNTVDGKWQSNGNRQLKHGFSEDVDKKLQKLDKAAENALGIAGEVSETLLKKTAIVAQSLSEVFKGTATSVLEFLKIE